MPFAVYPVPPTENRNSIMEALLFGETAELLDAATHDNVALFEQYEPLAAKNDELAYENDCELDNLYLVPAW